MIERPNKNLEIRFRTARRLGRIHILDGIMIQVILHKTIARTPTKILFGTELRLPKDFVFGYPVGEESEVNDYA